MYRYLRSALLTLPVVLAVSCGGSKFKGTLQPRPGAAASRFAYLSSGNATSIYTIDSHTGVLTLATPDSVAVGLSQQEAIPRQMVAEATGRFAYVLNLAINDDDNATISMYLVNASTGALTPAAPAMIDTGFSPKRITIDPYSKFVYATDSRDNLVSTFTIDSATGMLDRTKVTSGAAGKALVQLP